MPVTIPEPQFDELYREIVLDHYRRPRNRGELDDHTARLEGMNPVCGDEIQLDLKIEDGRVAEIAFSGQGCSISQASASMMTEQVKGKTTGEAWHVLEAFERMMKEEAEPTAELGDLEALQGVAKFPVRVKCALLAWKVLEDGLKGAAAAK
ncbi:MAG: SUF system NifU family Fe-S cluster assembly protein [Dehalococcoidia bacterium]